MNNRGRLRAKPPTTLQASFHRTPTISLLLVALICAGCAKPKAPTAQPRNAPEHLSQLLALGVGHEAQADIATANLLCREGLPGMENTNLPGHLATLDKWANRIQSETERNLYRYRANPREFEDSEAYFRMLIMAAVVYDDCRVRYNPDRMSTPSQIDSGEQFFADPADIFLHGLLGSRRMGTCSSMPVLYIALGRRLGYPLKLVATKSHLFIRWESDTERFNLEATGRGMNKYDDNHFKNWPFPVTDEEIKADGYLKSMTPAEELACFLSLRGHCLKANGRLPEAITAYSEAARLAPNIRAYQVLLADALQPSSQRFKVQGSSSDRHAEVRLQSSVAFRGSSPSLHLPSPTATAGPPDPNPILRIR
jgi:hypothetical protein